MLHVPESLETSEARLRFTQRGLPIHRTREHQPSLHRRTLRQKWTTEPLRFSMAFVLRSDRYSAPATPSLQKGQRLLEPFAHRSRGARMLALEGPSQPLELAVS